MSLSTILELLVNILDPPLQGDNAGASMKYRSIRLNNKTVKREIVDVKGALDITSYPPVAASFRKRVDDFEERLVFPSSPSKKQLYALQTSHYVTEATLLKVKATLEEEKVRKEAAKRETDMA